MIYLNDLEAFEVPENELTEDESNESSSEQTGILFFVLFI